MKIGGGADEGQEVEEAVDAPDDGAPGEDVGDEPGYVVDGVVGEHF